MKKFMKHILALAIVFATLSSNATEHTFLNNEEDGKTILKFGKVNQGDQLTVKDAFGLILYKEAIIENGQYNKSFDLTALPNGNYIFELDKQNQIRVYPFTVDINVVTFNKEKVSVLNKPKVTSNNNNIYITAQNPEQVNYTIEIFYDSVENTNEKIYSGTFKNTTTMGKKFRLLEDKDEAYKVVVTANGRSFTSTINF
ncbi:hypothetical protein [Psychroserpens sp. NJDZ02]|uniref:hypothetical protein n=1 Tax=Psychroserpens sp. NJDZ02 TaxID=2570561 RepID=UPI0010A93BD5|nr:hypothetical protein [Psychroserpens sp. NJDZ02]QCE41062.1 hypothetical protein E9099_06395 [Psychroserpens sp. NJDZ02]